MVNEGMPRKEVIVSGNACEEKRSESGTRLYCLYITIAFRLSLADSSNYAVFVKYSTRKIKTCQ